MAEEDVLSCFLGTETSLFIFLGGWERVPKRSDTGGSLSRLRDACTSWHGGTSHEYWNKPTNWCRILCIYCMYIDAPLAAKSLAGFLWSCKRSISLRNSLPGGQIAVNRRNLFLPLQLASIRSSWMFCLKLIWCITFGPPLGHVILLH